MWRNCCLNAHGEKDALTRQAFVDSIPVLMGYITMGFVAGVLLAAKAGLTYAPLWAFLTSALWVTGTMSIAVVNELAERASVWTIAGMTLAVNFRYAFYGFTMLTRWRRVPLKKKLYLVGMLTDENYALEAASPLPEGASYTRYCFMLSLFNHSYWVVGVVAGALVVYLLGRVIEPETIRQYTRGMEFSMAALFLVILTEQMKGFLQNGK